MMSLESLLTKDRIDVLLPEYGQTASMGVTRSYETIRGELRCRVTPLNVSERMKFQRDGYQVSHRMRFLTDPELTQDMRVKWKGRGKGTILRVSPAYNSCGVDRIWTVMALAHTEDNQTLAVVQ